MIIVNSYAVLWADSKRCPDPRVGAELERRIGFLVVPASSLRVLLPPRDGISRVSGFVVYVVPGDGPFQTLQCGC